MKNFMILVEAVLYLTGAASIEDLDEETICRFERMESFPVMINLCNQNALKESGLMSGYQAASLIEYRERTGDILSETELGLIEGFSPETAKAMMPFISLESSGSPGQKSRKYSRQEIILDAAGRKTDSFSWSSSVKYSYDNGVTSLNAGFRYKDGADGSVCAAYYGRKYLQLLVLGDYNLKYGQGGCLWSGFSLNGFPTVDAIYKKPSGICRSASSSQGSKFRGIAASFRTGHFTEDIFYSYNGILGGNIGFSSRSMEFDLTGYKGSGSWGTGFSGRGTIGATDLFGEAAITSEGLSVTAGTVWNIAYRVKCAALASKTADGHQYAAGIQFRDYSLTAERNPKYLKFIFNGTQALTPESSGFSSSLSAKASTKKQNRWKTECRIDWRNSWKGFELNARYDMLWNISHSSLAYLEAGYRKDRLYAYLRGTIFLIDNWDDRIYVYERDAPSSFNVPAYYGRGWNASFVLRWNNLFLRVATTCYPSGSKTAKGEIKIQYRLRW